eukprot:1073693_1
MEKAPYIADSSDKKSQAIRRTSQPIQPFYLQNERIPSHEQIYYPKSSSQSTFATTLAIQSLDLPPPHSPPPPTHANSHTHPRTQIRICSALCFKEQYQLQEHVSKNFIYSSDFDQNGLLFSLGCQGARSGYNNPAELGIVVVSASSIMSDSQPLSALVGRTTTRCLTQPQRGAWMCIDLKTVSINLTHYTLKHYATWDSEALRNWNLDGSKDGKSWTLISEHIDDHALHQAGSTHTWELDDPGFYSQFRIRMTGRNSNNHWYLCCSGFEMYGTIENNVDVVSTLTQTNVGNVANVDVDMLPVPTQGLKQTWGMCMWRMWMWICFRFRLKQTWRTWRMWMWFRL